MPAQTQYPHIVVDEHGAERIGKLRYKVLHLIAEHYYHGWSGEELLRQHPDLRPEEVYAALTYFYDHHDECIRRLNEVASQGNQARATHSSPFTREELLRRRKLANRVHYLPLA